eukprot:scaffold10477_cov49-Phaeocystis_antarctica.AAC.2
MSNVCLAEHRHFARCSRQVIPPASGVPSTRHRQRCRAGWRGLAPKEGVQCPVRSGQCGVHDGCGEGCSKGAASREGCREGCREGAVRGAVRGAVTGVVQGGVQ